MSPDYHAWTHSEGGTDPIQFPTSSAADMAWAYSLGFHSGAPSGGVYSFQFTTLRTNTPGFVSPSTVTSGHTDWIQLNEPGFYEVHSRCQYNSAGTLPTDRENELVPIYNDDGSPVRIRNGTGVADMTGTMFSSLAMQRDGEVGGLSLYDIVFFNYQPDDPASALDDFDPLEIGLEMDTDPASSTSYSFTAELFIKRLAATPGYGSDLIT